MTKILAPQEKRTSSVRDSCSKLDGTSHDGNHAINNRQTQEEPFWIKISDLSQDEWKELLTTHLDKDDGIRRRLIVRPVSELTPAKVLEQTPLTLIQHASVLFFMAIAPPNGVFTVPALLLLIGWAIGNIARAYCCFFWCVGIPLCLLPPTKFDPSTLYNYLAHATGQYFSATFVMETQLDAGPNRPPRLVVAPPHGVFPYGNIVGIFAWPLLVGNHLFAMMSSTALKVPICHQVMRSIGAVDATRQVGQELLGQQKTVGISSGGVAEVYETSETDECIVIQRRKGIIRLAIRGGADILPTYLFGNTKVLNCWYGQGLVSDSVVDSVATFSRKFGIALVWIYGRFGLPLPNRTPILCVTGKPIPTRHLQCDEPSKEVIEEVHRELLGALEDLFNKYKHLYGWEKKRLVMK